MKLNNVQKIMKTRFVDTLYYFINVLSIIVTYLTR